MVSLEKNQSEIGHINGLKWFVAVALFNMYC